MCFHFFDFLPFVLITRRSFVYHIMCVYVCGIFIVWCLHVVQWWWKAVWHCVIMRCGFYFACRPEIYYLFSLGIVRIVCGSYNVWTHSRQYLFVCVWLFLWDVVLWMKSSIRLFGGRRKKSVREMRVEIVQGLCLAYEWVSKCDVDKLIRVN